MLRPITTFFLNYAQQIKLDPSRDCGIILYASETLHSNSGLSTNYVLDDGIISIPHGLDWYNSDYNGLEYYLYANNVDYADTSYQFHTDMWLSIYSQNAPFTPRKRVTI